MAQPLVNQVASELCDKLSEQLCATDVGGTSEFYIDSFIKQLYTTSDVMLLLGPASEQRRHSNVTYASAVISERTGLLTILLNCRFDDKRKIGVALRGFVDEGITDNDLPFSRHERSGINRQHYKLCGYHHSRTTQHGCVFKITRNWTNAEIKEFDKMQWRVQAATFWKKPDENAPHFDIAYKVPLPYIENHEHDEDDTGYCHSGGFSHVWAVRIARGYQNLYLSAEEGEPLMAVKRLKLDDKLEFERETFMLKSPVIRDHRHIAELLATYRQDRRYHLLFPFAQRDLRRFWLSNVASDNGFSVTWVLDQITGLAGALEAIHEHKSSLALSDPNLGRTRFRTEVQGVRLQPGEERMFGRHGDIKPANILWRSDLGGPCGLLQLTDLGLGQFHGIESRSHLDPSKVIGSPTYMPPEVELGLEISRKYDIWSFGCVILEFIVWLLEGQSGLSRFNAARKETNYDMRVEDDTYFTLISSGGRSTKAIVRSAVTKRLRDLPKASFCCDALRDVIQLVETKMIVVRPETRASASTLNIEFREIYNRCKKK